MYRADEIRPLTDFQRNTKNYVQRLRETGRPELLTVHGRPEVVVQNAEAYQEMLDLLDRAEAIIGIKRGLDSMERGHGTPLEEAFGALRTKLEPGD